jgi:hypothetical protein
VKYIGVIDWKSVDPDQEARVFTSSISMNTTDRIRKALEGVSDLSL